MLFRKPSTRTRQSCDVDIIYIHQYLRGQVGICAHVATGFSNIRKVDIFINLKGGVHDILLFSFGDGALCKLGSDPTALPGDAGYG